ncbi:MAG TPA: NAD(P)H-binding protein [Tepidisphaeraceae bacterium]|jgi:NADH dehydrogenase|nr:NAD(P)H-binding protein [Tepidisphaeraceae bacterium]
MSRRIFVTGASGFVGSAIVAELLSRGFGVNALQRDDRELSKGDVTAVRGDIHDAAALERGMAGCAAVVHLVGIIRERPGATFYDIHQRGTTTVAKAAKSAGVSRFIHMSANGTRADAVSDYHKSKWLGEQFLREKSGLDWTIFRPSLIHGANGEFIQSAARWARGKAAPWLFMPYFGAGLFGTGGAGLMQPIFIDDVARAFVNAIDNEKSIHKIYELGGGEAVSWPQMHRAIAEAVVGKRRPVVPIPAWYAKAITYVVPGAMLPFNRAQVQMSQEDNTTDLNPFIEDFGWQPRDFSATLATYAAALR